MTWTLKDFAALNRHLSYRLDTPVLASPFTAEGPTVLNSRVKPKKTRYPLTSSQLQATSACAGARWSAFDEGGRGAPWDFVDEALDESQRSDNREVIFLLTTNREGRAICMFAQRL